MMRVSEGNLRSLYDEKWQDSWYRISSYYSLRYKHHEMLLHTHTAAEWMYVRAGMCGVRLGDGGIITLKEGDYIFLDSMVPHELIVEKGSPCHVLNIEISLVKKNEDFSIGRLRRNEGFNAFLQAAQPVFFSSDAEGAIGNHLSNLLRLIRRGNAEDETGHQMALLFFEVAGQFRKKQYKTNAIPPHVKKALAYISENFDSGLTISEIARAASVSRGHLQRSFHETVGCTMVSKINDFRINKAKILLRISTLPIVEIAINVGFNSRQHFSASFTKVTGLSPSQYRKQSVKWRETA